MVPINNVDDTKVAGMVPIHDDVVSLYPPLPKCVGTMYMYVLCYTIHSFKLCGGFVQWVSRRTIT